MEAAGESAGLLPVIKCSTCGDDVGMAAMTTHQCGASKSSSSAPTRLPPPPRTESSNSFRNVQSQRPLLPKIDPSAAFRPPVFPGELTPASSQHSSMVSPVSASSGTKSPWPANRKGSVPGPRRPPSPELTNLDCAFPPFPLPSRAPTTRQRQKSVTQGNDRQRSRSRTAPRLPRQDSRPMPPIRAGSSNTLADNAIIKQRDVKSRPTSPSTNSNPSTSNSRQQSLDNVPQVHGMESPKKQASISSSKTESILGPPSRQPLRSSSEPQARQGAPTDPALSAFDFRESVKIPADSTTLNPPPAPLETKIKAEPEPAYKSKRPPPLARDQFRPLTKIRSPTAPQPSSAGVLSKGFGRLFGRRRSQSMTARREVVRQALSDEPDVYEHQTLDQSMLSARSDRSFLTAEPSPLSTPSVTSPVSLPSHEESLKALEGITPTPKATPIVVVEPIDEEGLPPNPPVSDQVTVEVNIEAADMPDLVAKPLTPEPPAHEMDEPLRRMSVDSASSYGSIGFSEHATSSRSSSPRTESLAVKSFDSSLSSLLQSVKAEMPAPLRLGRAQTSPDSPTDPLFYQERQSPVPDAPHIPNASEETLPSTTFESPISPTPSLEPSAALNQKPKLAAPNKGVCRGCSQVILGTQKSVSSADGRLTGRYHKECFVCRTCKNSFPTAEFYVHDDHPYCAYHYHELENSLCATCGNGIEGVYMETANVAGRGKEKHHPECLKCTTCKIRLDHDYFELSGRVYCERDAFRIANTPKSRDNAPSRPSPLIREYISSGDRGLLRGRNFPERRTTRLMSMT